MTTQTGGTTYIVFNDFINQATANTIMKTCSDVIARFRPDEIYFLFASPGGDVASGIVLHTFLKSLPAKVTMHNIGRVDSIGNVVFAAGQRRLASPYTSFLFHGLSMPVHQPTSLTITILKEWASSLEADARKITTIIKSSSSFTDSELLDFFTQGETKDAEYVKTKGLVQEIIDPTIPSNARVITLS